MSSFALAIGALLVALLAQSLATAVAVECYLRKGQPALARRSWLALAVASLIFALRYRLAAHVHPSLPSTT